MMNSDGSNIQKFLDLGVNRFQWLPDGSHILFDATDDATTGITNVYLVQSDGKDLRQLTNASFDFPDYYPVWNPCGKLPLDLPPVAETKPIDPNCPVLPARLIVGQIGQSIKDGTGPSNVRPNPGVGQPITKIQEGESFQVIGGSECGIAKNGDRMRYFEIQTNSGQQGWIAEANDQRYFVEPQESLTNVTPTVSVGHFMVDSQTNLVQATANWSGATDGPHILDWGDGTTEEIRGTSGQEVTRNHNYPLGAGTYVIKLTITGLDGKPYGYATYIRIYGN